MEERILNPVHYNNGKIELNWLIELLEKGEDNDNN